MENKPPNQAIRPNHLGPAQSCLFLFDFCILNLLDPHSAFSLLHSTFSILPSLPILPPPCPLSDLTALAGDSPTAQNKANFKIGKIALNLCREKPYDQIPPTFPPRPAKNKANSIEAKPRSRCTSQPNHPTHDPLHAPRYTLHATRSTLHASLFTLRSSRDTRYEIRTPSPLRRPG